MVHVHRCATGGFFPGGLHAKEGVACDHNHSDFKRSIVHELLRGFSYRAWYRFHYSKVSFSESIKVQAHHLLGLKDRVPIISPPYRNRKHIDYIKLRMVSLLHCKSLNCLTEKQTTPEPVGHEHQSQTSGSPVSTNEPVPH